VGSQGLLQGAEFFQESQKQIYVNFIVRYARVKGTVVRNRRRGRRR